MCFWTYEPRKTVLDKCLKGRVSDDRSTSNMVNGSKHCWNLKNKTFTIFIDHCEDNWGLKSLPEWYAKSYDCLLTRWLPVTSIFFLKETIYCYTFRWNYLRNRKCFLNLFSQFLNLDSIFNIFKKNMALIAYVFSNLRTPENVFREVSRKFRFRGHF